MFLYVMLLPLIIILIARTLSVDRVVAPYILEIWGQRFNFPTSSPKIGSADPLHILHRVS